MSDTETAKLICACFFFMYFSWAIIDSILNSINRNSDTDVELNEVVRTEENNGKSVTVVEAV